MLGRKIKDHLLLVVAEAEKPSADGAGSARVYPDEVWLILSPAKTRAEERENTKGGARETGLCLYSG